MRELKLIKSEHFGEIEADIYSNDKDMFMTANQLCACLEESRSTLDNRVSRNPYLKDKEFSVSLKMRGTDGKMYDTRVFTEDGIYEITMLSGQPKAKEFRAWIRRILKELRRGEVRPQNQNPLAKEIAEAKVNNSRARVSSQWMKLAELVKQPEYKAICAHYASTALAGREVLPLPTSEQRYLQAKDIGQMLGVSANQIGKLANTYGLKTDRYGKWFHDKSPYSNKEVNSFRYNNEAVERFRDILKA